jgi:hypothetical protein
VSDGYDEGYEDAVADYQMHAALCTAEKAAFEPKAS